jgi:tRNA(Ile)-lysidine synthase
MSGGTGSICNAAERPVSCGWHRSDFSDSTDWIPDGKRAMSGKSDAAGQGHLPGRDSCGWSERLARAVQRAIDAAATSASGVIAVAYSGGRDSTALLHATLKPGGLEWQGERQVVALHVHHGLSANADAWAAHCQHQCHEWADRGAPVRFRSAQLSGKPSTGESIEAWARAGRYRALRAMSLEAGADVLLLAHHRRDQAETFFLQALRGGGLRGLSSMPRAIVRDGLVWLRPWLDQPREAIDAYVREHALDHIEDDSNADPRHARNRLRLQVWPLLVGAFAHAETALADAAAWAQQAGDALAELAQMDLAAVCGPQRQIGLATFDRLSPARQSNALRTWLAEYGGRSPSTHLVQRLLDEFPGSNPAMWLVPGGMLGRYRGQLTFHSQTDTLEQPAAAMARLSITSPGRYAVPSWTGALIVERVETGGTALGMLSDVRLMRRSGGESFQAARERPARSLKKQFQAAGIPEWLRNGPLVYAGSRLTYVPGLGIDARVLAAPGELQVDLRWQPAAKMAGCPE